MKRVLLAALALLAAAVSARADGDGFAKCSEHLPFGIPTLSIDIKSTPVCHKGYAVLHDDELLIPRWVAYHLTGPHTLGCEKRGNNFHSEESLSPDHRATPKDYTGSGYDRGHQAPAADFSWSKPRLSDSFSMANMAPQVGGLNRQEWEHLEETVRAWALQRGELVIYVGPVLAKHPKTIGDGVAVPRAFFKVIVDEEAKEALAFVMPQKDLAKGSLEPWQVTISDIEEAASIALPLPDGIDRDSEQKLWPADLPAWKRKHQAACAH